MFFAALAVRLPYFNLIPSYTDEVFEVLWGIDIALGKHFPLYGYPPHYGPLFAYLIAILFRVFGTGVDLPRLLIVGFGAATVPATYVLVRVIHDRTTALIASGLTLTTPLLVVYASHQGWSSGLTPLLTTSTAFALYIGVTTRKNIYFALSGLFAGFTLQAHATTGAALIGMVFWFLLRRDLVFWLKQPAPYLALGFFLLGYAPMIIANMGGDSPLLRAAYDHSYAFIPTLDPAEYLRRVIILFKSYGYFAGEGLGEPTSFLRAQAIMIQIFLIAGLAWALYTRFWLIPFTILGMFIILPVIAIPDGYRYSMNLIPMADGLIAYLLVAIWHAVSVKISRPDQLRPQRAAALTFVVLFLASPLFTIWNFYRNASTHSWTNEAYFALVQAVRAQYACGTRLFVENRALNPNSGENIATFYTLTNVDYLLTLDGCAHTFADLTRIAKMMSTTQDAWIITPLDKVDHLVFEPLAPQFNLNLDEFLVPTNLYRVNYQP